MASRRADQVMARNRPAVRRPTRSPINPKKPRSLRRRTPGRTLKPNLRNRKGSETYENLPAGIHYAPFQSAQTGHQPIERTRTSEGGIRAHDYRRCGRGGRTWHATQRREEGEQACSPIRARQAAREEQGRSEDRAEEIAARTVNKERAQSGESRRRSRTSTRDISSGRRGGQRSGRSGPRGRTRDQLYNEALQLSIDERSKMSKAQLQRAVAGKKS